jgi:hypothetical protein
MDQVPVAALVALWRECLQGLAVRQQPETTYSTSTKWSVWMVPDTHSWYKTNIGCQTVHWIACNEQCFQALTRLPDIREKHYISPNSSGIRISSTFISLAFLTSLKHQEPRSFSQEIMLPVYVMDCDVFTQHLMMTMKWPLCNQRTCIIIQMASDRRCMFC